MKRFIITLLLECKNDTTANNYAENLVLDGQESLLHDGVDAERLKLIDITEIPEDGDV